MIFTQNLITFLFFLLIIILLIFKIYNFKKIYTDLIVILLMLLGAFEFSFLNGPSVIKMYKNKSDEYIKEINVKYPPAQYNQIPVEYSSISKVISKLSYLSPSINNNISILRNGDETYNAIFTEMNNAKNHIHIEDFIIRDDEVGKKFQQILIKKSTQGVKVRIIVDGFGLKLKGSSIRKLKKAGVELVINDSILKSLFQGNFNNRDHRKIYIIDGKTAFTGGINIGNEYLGINPQIGYWRDTDIMLRGECVRDLQSIFLSSWYANTGQKIFDLVYYPKSTVTNKTAVQIATGSPSKYNPIEYAYLELIKSAKKSILIETPYLTLDDLLFKALSSASRSGIDVTIIIPSKTDEKIAYSSTLCTADKLSTLGVKVYKYPALIHSKIIIIDETVTSIGTVNLNNRSMHLDFEDSVIVYGGIILDSFNKIVKEDLSKSRPFIPSESKPKGILNIFYNSLARIFYDNI